MPVPSFGKLKIVGQFAAIFCLATGIAIAQGSSGTITGRVDDQKHGLLPKATVIVRSDDTRTEYKVTTDGDGTYRLSELVPGTYTVTIDKPGFETVVITGVIVNIAATATADATLPIGTNNDSITVLAQAQLTNQEDPTISTAVPQILSQELPFGERSSLAVVMLAPGVQGDPQSDMGVQSENPGIFTGPVIPGGSLSIGGGRPGTALLLIDGQDMSLVGYNRVALTFSGDDIGQTTIQTAAVTARFGRSGGGVVNQGSKGGASKLHGKLSWRHQDPFLEATTYGQGNFSFTNPSTGTRFLRPVTQDVHQQLFTALLSGPVPTDFMHLRQNTFFLVSYEPLRGGNKIWSRNRVITPAEIAGDFSKSYSLMSPAGLAANGYGYEVAQIAASIASGQSVNGVGGLAYQFPLNPQGFTTGTRYTATSQYVPVPGYNLSAQLAQNPFAKYVLSLMPQPGPNGEGTKYINFIYPDAHYDTDGNNAYVARGVQNADNRYNTRIDHTFSSADHAFARFTYVPVTGLRFYFMGPESPIDNQPTQTVNSLNGLFNHSHIFGGKIVNDITASYTRADYNNTPAPASTNIDYAAKYGLTPAQIGVGFPSMNIDGSNSYGSATGGNDGGLSLNQIYSFSDNVSMVVGRHALTFGGEFRYLMLDRQPNAGIYGGSYSFPANFTAASFGGGNATASFILGNVGALTLSTIQTFYYRSKYGAAYFMDQWRILPKLTLSLGLRYNLETPRTEKNGLQGSFLPDVTGTLNGVAATGAFAFSGTNGLPTTLWPTNYRGFEPRIGLAWAIRPELVVSASYNLMHGPITGISNSSIPSLTPSSLSIGGSNGGTNPAAFVNYMTNPVALPAGGVPAYLKPPNPLFSYGTGYLPYVSQSSTVPYTENWSLSIQQQFGKGTFFQMSYVGAQSHHQFTPLTASNILPLNTYYSQVTSGYAFNTTTVPWAYNPAIKVNANVNAAPYPQFETSTTAVNPIQTAFVRDGSSSYNGGYLSGQHRLSKLLTVLGSLTWAKTMDDGSGGSLDGNGYTGIFGLSYQQTPYSRKGERGLSNYDVPLRAALGYNYVFPIGRGMLIHSKSSLVNRLIGGLSTSGMFNVQQGYPFWPTLGTVGTWCSNSVTAKTAGGSTSYTPTWCGGGNAFTTGSGNFTLRPNVNPGVALKNPNWRKDPFNLSGSTTGAGGYVNPQAFSMPGTFGNYSGGSTISANAPVFGNASRTLSSIRSPNTLYFNMSGTKLFALRDGKINVAVRADVLNALNHTNFFLNPNAQHNLFSGITTSNVGTLSAPVYQPVPTQNPTFGALSASNNTPGRTFGLSASVTF